MEDELLHISSQRPRIRPSPSTALWGHILRKTGSSQVPPSSAGSTNTLGKHTPTITPVDKAGASTRILLHDTQAHLERFTDRVNQLTMGLNDAKRELVCVKQLYQDDHEQLLDRMTGLANRCQTELQKTIGTPAQSSELHDAAKDVSHLSNRVEALDKRIDTLYTLSQTQSQALQTIQDQQSQLITALVPILPLLQAIPLHIENARNQMKEAVLELRAEVISSDSANTGVHSGHGGSSHLPQRFAVRSAVPSVSDESAPTPPQRKRRRLEITSDASRHTPVATNTGSRNRSSSKATSPVYDSAIARGSADPNPGSHPMSLHARVSNRTPSRDLVGLRQHPGTPTRALLSPSHSAAAARLSDGRRSIVSKSAAITSAFVVHANHISGSLSRACTMSAGSQSVHSSAGAIHPVRETSRPRIMNNASTGFSAGDRWLPTDHTKALASTTPTRRKGEGSIHPSHSPSLPPRRPSYMLPTRITPVRGSDTTTRAPSIEPQTLCAAVAARTRVPSIPPPSTGKPMSLKDRRALFAEDHQRDHGKRFIPLEDEEDEDVNSML